MGFSIRKSVAVLLSLSSLLVSHGCGNGLKEAQAEISRLQIECKAMEEKNKALTQEIEGLKERAAELSATPEAKYRQLASDFQGASTIEQYQAVETNAEHFQQEFPTSSLGPEAISIGKQAKASRTNLEEQARREAAESDAARKREELLKGEYVTWEDFLVMATQGITVGKRYQFYASLEMGASPKICEETKGWGEEGFCWGSAYKVDLVMDNKEAERGIILGKGIKSGTMVVSMQRRGGFALHAFE